MPLAREFKYIWVLFTGEGKMKRERDRRFGRASAVLTREQTKHAGSPGRAGKCFWGEGRLEFPPTPVDPAPEKPKYMDGWM